MFNQSAGMDSGFGADDGYGVYSKPMFNRGEAQSLYRPKGDDGDAWGDADQQVDLSPVYRLESELLGHGKKSLAVSYLLTLALTCD